jgi:adenylosuccinate synthase
MSTHIVVDLGFGDAGKGTIVDALARRCSTPPLVVRHNGGAQAGHNVVTSDGRQHVFSQFGAATFVPGSKTLLSKHFVLHPGGLMAENAHLESLGVNDALDRLRIDERALVITPYHQAMNRLREAARGAGKHGTCGLGVGETVADSLEEGDHIVRAFDLCNTKGLYWKLYYTRERKLTQIEPLLHLIDPANNDLAFLRSPGTLEHTMLAFESIGKELLTFSPSAVNDLLHHREDVIFEGAQGVLLDEWHGFHPHTTWSTTTTKNADAMIAEAERGGPVNRIGVVRAYATRHGQGPFPTENAMLTKLLRETTNADDGAQGRFRCGWFDVPLTKYALSCSPGIDSLAITCLDRLKDVPEWSICDGYTYISNVPGTVLRAGPAGDLAYQEQLTRFLNTCTPVLRKVSSINYVREIEACTHLPVSVMSFGPTAEEKHWT